jgi:two-component system sensor histidine kinase CpxA
MAERLSSYVHGQKRFLSDVAHELCSPVARLQVALAILDQRAAPDQQESVRDAQEEVEHMSGLINELLSFSKSQIGSSTKELTRVNVADTVSSVLERERSQSVVVETQVDSNLDVMAEPDFLFRSLANLVRNAIRYAGHAGPIQVSAASIGKDVSIRVSDQGPGVPDAEIEEIFKPFYRPEFARQRETGGAGLGLAIVKSCIEACGGIVRCRNRFPRGLEVEIRLPAHH